MLGNSLPVGSAQQTTKLTQNNQAVHKKEYVMHIFRVSSIPRNASANNFQRHGILASDPSSKSVSQQNDQGSNCPCTVLGTQGSCVVLRGFSLRGFWDVRGFPVCGGKKALVP